MSAAVPAKGLSRHQQFVAQALGQTAVPAAPIEEEVPSAAYDPSLGRHGNFVARARPNPASLNTPTAPAKVPGIRKVAPWEFVLASWQNPVGSSIPASMKRIGGDLEEVREQVLADLVTRRPVEEEDLSEQERLTRCYETALDLRFQLEGVKRAGSLKKDLNPGSVMGPKDALPMTVDSLLFELRRRLV